MDPSDATATTPAPPPPPTPTPGGRADDRPTRVGFLLADGFSLLAFASASEPLHAANALAGRPLYRVRCVPLPGAEARASSSAVVPADAQVGEGVDYDLVLVVAEEAPRAIDLRLVAPWLRALARRGVRLGGIAAGAVILARVGLMAGRRVALGPRHAADLLDDDPDLALERTVFAIDRDRLSCPGGTAPLAMMRALIEEMHGPDLARAVGERFAPEERPPGDAPAGGRARHPALLAAVSTMEGRLAEPLDLAAIARESGVGPRQLNRLFREALGTSAMAHYRAIRLDRARALLERSRMSVTEIALATGFQNFSHFATAFRRRHGRSPREHRGGHRGGVAESVTAD